MTEVPIHQIVCIDAAGGIGLNGGLPWSIEKDWQYFLQHSLRVLNPEKPSVCWILGRASYQLHSQKNGLFEDLEKEVKIIKIVLSRKWKEVPQNCENTYLAQSWLDVETTVQSLKDKISEAWNIGGPKVYEAQLLWNTDKRSLADSSRGAKLFLTKLHQAFQCDTFYPGQYLEKLQYIEDEKDVIWAEENGVKLSFHVHDLQQIAFSGRHKAKKSM